MPSPKVRFVLAAALAAATPACARVVIDTAPESSTPSTSSAGTGGASTASSASSASSASASGSGGAGGATTGGEGGMNAGGAGGAPEPTCSGSTGAGGNDVPPPPLSCGGGQAVVYGEVDGQPIMVPTQVNGLIRSQEYYWQGLGASGNAYFTGDTSFIVGNSTVHASRAWLQMPEGAPDALSWFCDDTGANVGFASPQNKSLVAGATLADLRKLGACPGVPVSGQLDYCLVGSTTCSWGTFQGTIGGDPITAPSISGGLGSGWPGPQVVTLDDGGLLVIRVTGGKPTGILIRPGCGPNAGGLYCIGSITPGPLPDKLVLGELSRLGTCAEAPAVAGSLSMCVSY